MDWYVRLEQGRACGISLQTIEKLAEALHLTDQESEHLCILAKVDSRAAAAKNISPTMETFLRTIDSPAYVLGPRWDILLWNQAAAELLGIEALNPEKKNLLVYLFDDPRGKLLLGGHWETEVQRILAQFRSVYDRFPGDQGFQELVAGLLHDSQDFKRLWARHDVKFRSSGKKELRHPTQGIVEYSYLSFHPAEDSELTLVVYLRSDL